MTKGRFFCHKKVTEEPSPCHTEDRAAVDSYLENEPYVIENVWQRIDVQQMNVVILNGEMLGK